jgi:hypothetical protein
MQGDTESIGLTRERYSEWLEAEKTRMEEDGEAAEYVEAWLMYHQDLYDRANYDLSGESCAAVTLIEFISTVEGDNLSNANWTSMAREFRDMGRGVALVANDVRIAFVKDRYFPYYADAPENEQAQIDTDINRGTVRTDSDADGFISFTEYIRERLFQLSPQFYDPKYVDTEKLWVEVAGCGVDDLSRTMLHEWVTREAVSGGFDGTIKEDAMKAFYDSFFDRALGVGGEEDDGSIEPPIDGEDVEAATVGRRLSGDVLAKAAFEA